MRTARQDPIRFLHRENQFCSLCRAAGKPLVRVANVARIQSIGLRAFKVERRRLALAHLRAEHPAQYAQVSSTQEVHGGR